MRPILVLFCGGVLAACTRSGSSADTASTPATPAGAAQDAILVARGTVAIVGADPSTWVVLRGADGTQRRVSGPAEPLLRNVGGAEVIVSGGPDGAGIRAHNFTVVMVGGRAVHDGVVVVRDGAVWVRTKEGEQGVPNAPAALREMPGARVWVTHAVQGVAPSYGVISR